VISDKEIEELETWMDEMEEKVEPLQYLFYRRKSVFFT
jgi:cob(I)alamin adenosyltransferase